VQWAEVRGPIGGTRWDYYVALLGALTSRASEPDIRDFLAMLPWVRREDLT
jgi:hypothetical protein